jgi:hypothetical protein
MKRTAIKKRALLHIDAAGVIIFIAASLGMYFAVLLPHIQQRPILDGLVRQLSVQNETSSKLKASVLMLRNQLSYVKEELLQSQNKLEEASQINQRIADITTFLTDDGLQVDQIKIGSPHQLSQSKISSQDKIMAKNDSSVGAGLAGVKCDLVPIDISGGGGYRQCVAFLHRLHRTFPDITLARFELRGNPASTDKTPAFSFELFWIVEIKERASQGQEMRNEI